MKIFRDFTKNHILFYFTRIYSAILPHVFQCSVMDFCRCTISIFLFMCTNKNWNWKTEKKTKKSDLQVFLKKKIAKSPRNAWFLWVIWQQMPYFIGKYTNFSKPPGGSRHNVTVIGAWSKLRSKLLNTIFKACIKYLLYFDLMLLI